MTRSSDGYASYKIVFTEDLKKVAGAPVATNYSTHFMNVVKQRDPRLHSDILRFLEDFHDTNFFWGKPTDEYTTPKFGPAEEWYECPVCGFDELPDDKVLCPKCKNVMDNDDNF
jgi:rubrerythrin